MAAPTRIDLNVVLSVMFCLIILNLKRSCTPCCSLFPVTFCCLPHLAPRLIIIDHPALVSLFPSAGKSDQCFDVPPAEVDLQWYERYTTPGRFTDESSDLRAVEEQFPRPLRFMICVSSLLIRRDVAVEEPDLTALDTGIAASEVRPAHPETFHFCPLQNDTCFERFEDLVVPSSPFICCYLTLSHTTNDIKV